MLTTGGLREDATPLYAPYETLIDDWHALNAAVDQLGDAYLHEQFVWRGQADASWVSSAPSTDRWRSSCGEYRPKRTWLPRSAGC